MKLEHTVGCTEIVGCHQDHQLELLGIYLFEALDDRHVVGQCLLQIVGTLVADLHQQGCRLAIDEGIDAFVHVVVAGNGPVEPLGKRVERPESGIVALGGDDLPGACQSSHLTGEVVGTADMSAEDGDDVEAEAVDADDGGILVLVVDVRSDGPDADAHGPDENKGVELLPLSAHFRALDYFGFQLALER